MRTRFQKSASPRLHDLIRHHAALVGDVAVPQRSRRLISSIPIWTSGMMT